MNPGRINLIFIFFILFSAVLLSKLFFIQILQGEFYKALAQGLYPSNNEQAGERGEFLFNNGEYLAINMNWPLIFSSPVEIIDKVATAEILAGVLNLDKDLILEKLEKDNLYEVIKKKVTEAEIEKIKELNLVGVYLGQETGRYYPQETLAAQVIGFVSAEGKGQYGLEEYYDEILAESNLVLTLDYNIQFQAEKLLAAAKENLDIEGGEIIVIDPNSGKILALANFPNFNPNQYSQYAKEGNLEIFQNGATQKIFEPGSAFKPITFAAALEEEKITPQTTYIDEGQVKIEGWPKPIYNYNERIHGEQTMTEVLEKSINTGAVFVEKELGHDLFLKYLEQFGIFKPTGINLPEIYSENKEFKKGYEINFATASFGQGIEMTPIQLARAYCAIANGGKLVTPYLVDDLPDFNGEQVISRKTASQLAAMLVSVVENGFAKGAQIPGYYIAGKTGTAQIPEGGVYSSEKTIQSFIGFAPAFNPQFLILIKLNNPKTKTAEYSAVPIFHSLSKYIIDYWQIPPDYEL